MKKISLLISIPIVARLILAACGTPATQAPQPTQAPATEATQVTEAPAATEPAAETPLFVVINKSADQQYFIDLQNSFVEEATSQGAEAKKFDAKLDPNLGVSLVNDAI